MVQCPVGGLHARIARAAFRCAGCRLVVEVGETAVLDQPSWRQKLALAAITGLVSGAVRADVTWALQH